LIPKRDECFPTARFTLLCGSSVNSGFINLKSSAALRPSVVIFSMLSSRGIDPPAFQCLGTLRETFNKLFEFRGGRRIADGRFLTLQFAEHGLVILELGQLRSVELNVVLWAKAGTVLRANRAATAGSGRNRERFFGASIFFILFLCVCLFSVSADGTRRQ
jgi:hypothetical protein